MYKIIKIIKTIMSRGAYSSWAHLNIETNYHFSLSIRFLKMFRLEAVTTSSGSLFHWLTTLCVKKLPVRWSLARCLLSCGLFLCLEAVSKSSPFKCCNYCEGSCRVQLGYPCVVVFPTLADKV